MKDNEAPSGLRPGYLLPVLRQVPSGTWLRRERNPSRRRHSLWRRTAEAPLSGTKGDKSWAYQKGNNPNKIHFFLSNLSLRVRYEQYIIFQNLFKPKITDKIIDIGVSSVEELPDTNYFEKVYPYPNKLTAASIDDPLDFQKRYPKLKFQKIAPNKPLPFKKQSFDIVVSWATLEHVGSKEKQKIFLKELFRIGKKVFITVPYRGCVYEPHSGLFLVHWLPRKWFYIICRFFKKDFWASENNLRSLWIREVKEILPKDLKIKIITFNTFYIFPSHLLIVKE